jgi:hypothetical protein
MRNAEAYARHSKRSGRFAAVRRIMPFAAAKRAGRESAGESEEIQWVPVLPRNRPNLAAVCWNNVLLFAHYDGGKKTGRVDRFV